MNLRKLVIGSVVAGGISLSITGGLAYQYVSKMNKQLDTYVLPHTVFEGIPLGGKTKQEVQQIIQKRVDKLNQQHLSYSLQNTKSTYTWKDLGVQYKGLDVADKIFKEQKGTIIERYNLRKQAEKGQTQKEYHLGVYLDPSKYEAFLKDKYNELVSNPQNASISITGTNISITPSKDGEKVDKEKLKILTEEAVKTMNTDIKVPVTAVKPERTTEDIQNMGIKEVIAEYRTPTSGRNGNQLFNEMRAAGTLSGALVAPDEVFSFNGHVGVTDTANGYKSAAVYVNGKVQESAGGGVCQVSSTLYGATLRADLSIVERSNHSMPVHYVPLGQDATVADYGPDFKFKNNTGHYIYIQAGIENNQVVVRIFGTNTGKSVNISSQVVNETDKSIVAVTYKTVTQNGQVIESGLLNKSTYKKYA
jgi:vancomycin resistance protein YoaR